jgi:hypothetical protein
MRRPTHHSSGPCAKKPRKAAQFKRWAPLCSTSNMPPVSVQPWCNTATRYSQVLAASERVRHRLHAAAPTSPCSRVGVVAPPRRLTEYPCQRNHNHNPLAYPAHQVLQSFKIHVYLL